MLFFSRPTLFNSPKFLILRLEIKLSESFFVFYRWELLVFKDLVFIVFLFRFSKKLGHFLEFNEVGDKRINLDSRDLEYVGIYYQQRDNIKIRNNKVKVRCKKFVLETE